MVTNDCSIGKNNKKNGNTNDNMNSKNGNMKDINDKNGNTNDNKRQKRQYEQQ